MNRTSLLMSLRAAAFAACTLFAVTGCDDASTGAADDVADTNADDTAADDVSDTVEPTENPACPTLTEPVSFGAGLWASRQVLTSIATLPPENTPGEVVTTSLVLHQISDDGAGGLSTQNTVCTLSQPPRTGVETVFGDSFLEAIPVTTASASVTGSEVVFGEDVFVLGASLDDERTDDLPASVDDPRVSDTDNDGNPGVTVVLSGLIQGEIYVAYRQLGGLTGTIDANGCIEGLMDGSLSQVELDASEPVLATFKLNPSKHPDPERSTFVALPVAAGTGCAALIEQAPALFGLTGQE